MSGPQDWARLLAAAGHPSPDDDRDGLLHTAVGLGLQVAPSTIGCSLTEITGTGPRTPVASGPLPLALDGAQYQAGGGPCLTSARDQQPQPVDDLQHQQDRYPGFTAAAAAAGARSMLSLPLTGTPHPTALNLYAGTPAAFAADRPQAVAGLLARCAAALLTPNSTAAAHSPDLAAALAAHTVISRAQDTLMARRQLTRQDAFRQLVEWSRAQDRSVLAVARDLLQDHHPEPAK